MAEDSKIVVATVTGLVSADPALTIPTSKVSKFDINCETDQTLDASNGKQTIVFPSGATKAIPSGGCIIKLSGFPNPDLASDNISEKVRIFELAVSNLETNTSVMNLFDLKREISKSLYDIFFKSPITNQNSLAPNTYFSIYKTDFASDLPPASENSSKIKKIAKLTYIPYNVLTKLVQNLFQKEKLKNILSGAGGISINFDDYKTEQSSAEALAKLMLEFVPYFNISERELEGENALRNYKDHGGYFTIFNGDMYVKLPDISSRDYRAKFGNFYEDLLESKFILQTYFAPGSTNSNQKDNKSSANITNFVVDFESVFGAEIADYDESYLFGESVEQYNVEISGFNLSQDLTPYLSLIHPSKKPFNVKIEGYNDVDYQFPDLYPCPNSEFFCDSNSISNSAIQKTLDSKSSKKTILDSHYNLIKNYLNASKRTSLLSSFSLSGSEGSFSFDGSSGIPTSIFSYGDINRGSNAQSLFGDLSRQDELLAASKDGILNLKKQSVTKNYFSSKSMNSSNFGLQIRPRIYQDYHIPKSWIKGTLSESSDNPDNFVATFNSQDLNNFSAYNGIISFALYLSDGKGQIYRVSDQVIEISASPPDVVEANPSGFKESGIVVKVSSIITIIGDNFSKGTKVKVGGVDAEIITLTTKKIKVKIPAGVSGSQNVVVTNGTSEDSSRKVFVGEVDTKVADLPSEGTYGVKTLFNEISAKTLGEIPISYDVPTSKITLKSQKKTFEESKLGKLNALFYIKTKNADDIKLINFISNDFQTLAEDPTTYVFNNIRWNLSSNLASDFIRISDKKATLNFPGSGNSNKPLQYLSDLSPEAIAGVYITSEVNISSITSSNSKACSFKIADDIKTPIFSGQPFIVGMAGSSSDFDDEQSYFVNFKINQFNGSDIGTSLEEIIKQELFGGTSSKDLNDFFGPIKSIENLSKLIIFFNSASKIRESTQKHSFYIGGSKVSELKVFDVERIKNTNIWKAVIKNLDTKPYANGFANVVVKRRDKKRNIEIDSESLYYDLTSKNDDSGLFSTVETPAGPVLKSNKDIIVPSLIGTPSDSVSLGLSGINDSSLKNIFNFYSPKSYIFGNQAKLTLSSTVLGNNYYEADQLVDFTEGILYQEAIRKGTSESNARAASNPFYPIEMSSEYSDATLYTDPLYAKTLSDKGISAPDISLTSFPRELSYLPLYVKIPSGSTIFNYSPTSIGSYAGNYKSYHRFKVTNHANILINYATIINVEPKSFVGGQDVEITVSGINVKKAKVYIEGKRARVKNNDGKNKIIVVAPKSIDGIKIIDGKCQEIEVKPTSASLLAAEADLGFNFVNDSINALTAKINGFTADAMGKVEDLINKVKDFFLKFINIALDKANIAKEFINSFCDMSFHLTLELNLYLKNFSILLIPIKVIFCIIDVICSLLNPVKLAKAIIRLFECLYDLLLLLPQISIPVMFLQLCLHLLELLECIITKVINTVAIIIIIIGAITELANLIAQDKPVDFRYLAMLESLILENLIVIEADLQVLGPIAQILGLFLQLLQISFRFPCEIGPQSGAVDCGIDGSMLAGMVIGTITNDDGTLKEEYLLPVAQTIPISTSSFSDEDLTISEIRGTISGGASDVQEPISGSVAISKTSEESFFDNLNVNSTNYRFTANQNVCLIASITKTTKTFGKPTDIKFLFKSAGQPQFFRKLVDTNSPIDSPISLLNKDSTGNSLLISGNTLPTERNIFSLTDGEEFLNILSDGNKASVKPLSLPIEVDGVTVQRVFEGIPKMVLMDELNNIYYVDEEGIDLDSDFKIKSISAKIVNTSYAPQNDYNVANETIDNTPDIEDDEEFENINIYRFPKLYFVDVRAAAELIQTQCSTASINNFVLDQSDPDITSDIIGSVNDCLTKFTGTILGKVSSMRIEMSEGKIPTTFSENFVEDLADELKGCINKALDDVCPQVVNMLNTSLKVLEDTDLTPITALPDLIVPPNVMEGFETSGPPLTGAREYAAGIGNYATIEIDKEATIEIIPRDSYDDIITSQYDMSDKILVQIISDTTGAARIVNKNVNGILKPVTKADFGYYYSYVTSSRPGIVKLKVKVCNKTIQALTYSGIEGIIDGGVDAGIDCVPDSPVTNVLDVTPLGALSKIDRIITVEFTEKAKVITIVTGESGLDDVIKTEPQIFGNRLDN